MSYVDQPLPQNIQGESSLEKDSEDQEIINVVF